MQRPALAVFLALMSLLALACGPAAPTIAPISPTATPAAAATATPALPAATTPAAGATATPAATPAPAGTSEPAPTSLNLRTVIVKLDSYGQASALETGGRMVSREDHYGLYFRPEQEAYIYALQQDSTGKIDVLFPNPEYSQQTNPVPANQTVWVPRDIDHWFFLDENTGKERIFVVASKERIATLEAFLPGSSSSPGPDAVLALLTDPGRGVGGVTKSAVPVSLPDDQTVDLETVVLETSGDNFVYAVEFDHVGVPR